MRKYYDFSDGKKNPFAKKIKKGIHIRIDKAALAYFKDLAAKEGIPYQTLMNSFLVDCMNKKRVMHVDWGD